MAEVDQTLGPAGGSARVGLRAAGTKTGRWLILLGLFHWVGTVVAAGGSGTLAAVAHKLSLPPAAEMTRADLYTLNVVANPQAILVLCPGLNGDGAGLINQPTWQEFARANRLALCGISFASPEKEVQALRGYVHAERGSGELLARGLQLSFGRNLPILIYGFSCGARFAVSVVAWRPAWVLGWCAYSTSWWEEPQALSSEAAPGIVSCGADDTSNFGTSTTFFAKGRAQGLRWTWLSLADTAHVWSEPLDGFVRAYFQAALKQRATPGFEQSTVKPPPAAAGIWQDVDTKQIISAAQASEQPTLASWLPSASLSLPWSHLHFP